MSDSNKKCLSEDNICGIIKDYIEKCKNDGEIPNLAGFCIHSKIKKRQLKRMKEENPDDYELLLNYLENSALNANAPAALLTPYLKKYFGYGENCREEENKNIIVRFDHDIEKDGE